MLTADMKIDEVRKVPHSSEEFYNYLIDRLCLLGYSVERKTDYHFRVNKILDVYPVNRRWHDIEANKRGGYEDVFSFVRRYFGPRV